MPRRNYKPRLRTNHRTPGPPPAKRPSSPQRGHMIYERMARDLVERGLRDRTILDHVFTPASTS